MLTISKSKLKSNMLEIFRTIETNGEDLIVTHYGQPVLRITPYRKRSDVAEVFSAIRGKVVIREDLDKPTLDEWGDI